MPTGFRVAAWPGKDSDRGAQVRTESLGSDLACALPCRQRIAWVFAACLLGGCAQLVECMDLTPRRPLLAAGARPWIERWHALPLAGDLHG